MLPSSSQKYRISILPDFWRLIVLLTIPTVVELSIWIGVGGCLWPSSFALWKSAPSSALAADDATKRNVEQMTLIAPLSLMGMLGFGREPKKKYPDARLRALGALR
jgi:hypothetical protein